MQIISSQDLKATILGDREFALIDVREQGTFSQSHLLFAACVPLSQLELMVAPLIPKKDTRVVVVDESAAAGGFGERGVARLEESGYTNVLLLDGGVQGWKAAGHELFSGVNVPSKAFGEFVENTYKTPRLPAKEVKAMLDAGRNMVIVDSRPFTEYHNMNIPTGTNMPGAELAYRIHDLAPDPETLVVVNCAGRTRSIIGCQSLINAGIRNPVAALKDGTMGWHLAGFKVEKGSVREASAPGPDGKEKALQAATRVAARFDVKTVPAATVERWKDDGARTTYLLDVRSPAEYEAGHLPGWRHAPGGQLVQATDEYVAVKNSRIVLCDDIGVRATMTASWLIQMGLPEVYVLEDGAAGAELIVDAAAPTAANVPTLSPAQLAASSDVTVIDVGPSNSYERSHIPSAVWCTRARLPEVLEALTGMLVFTSPDGVLASFATADAIHAGRESAALEGGTDAWVSEARCIETGLEHAMGPTDDVWYKPYEHRGAQERYMREYLSWEVALVEQLERDGTTRFKVF